MGTSGFCLLIIMVIIPLRIINVEFAAFEIILSANPTTEKSFFVR
jgi:hypothetical protein